MRGSLSLHQDINSQALVSPKLTGESLLSIGQCILYMEGQEDQLYITIEDIYKRYNDSNNTYIQLNCSEFEEGALVICPTILLSN